MRGREKCRHFNQVEENVLMKRQLRGFTARVLDDRTSMLDIFSYISQLQ